RTPITARTRRALPVCSSLPSAFFAVATSSTTTMPGGSWSSSSADSGTAQQALPGWVSTRRRVTALARSFRSALGERTLDANNPLAAPCVAAKNPTSPPGAAPRRGRGVLLHPADAGRLAELQLAGLAGRDEAEDVDLVVDPEHFGDHGPGGQGLADDH